MRINKNFKDFKKNHIRKIDQILFKSYIDNPFQVELHDDQGKPVSFILNNSYIEIYYPSEIEYSLIEIKSTYSNIYKNSQKITVQK